LKNYIDAFEIGVPARNNLNGSQYILCQPESSPSNASPGTFACIAWHRSGDHAPVWNIDHDSNNFERFYY